LTLLLRDCIFARMPAQSQRSDPRSTPVQFVKGIGPRKSAVLGKAGIRSVDDLLHHVPRKYLDRTTILSIEELRNTLLRDPKTSEPLNNGTRREFTVLGEVRSFRVLGAGRRSRFVLNLGDETGSAQCIWFGGVQYWRRMFRFGELLAVSGQPSFYGAVLQFVHPDIDRISSRGETDPDQKNAPTDRHWVSALHSGGLVPLYPSSQELGKMGLDSAGFRRLIAAALQKYGDRYEEVLPPSLVTRRKLISPSEALRYVHFPRSAEQLASGLKRLKYEELFLYQLKLGVKRHAARDESTGIAYAIQSKLARQLVDSLAFALTHAQRRVINEITADMASPRPMNRLLQGDVGSGKTIVALVAMLIAVENGYQAAFMAPTELLAEQHFGTLKQLLGNIAVNVRFLAGGQKSVTRRDVLEDVSSGAAQIVLGTHALFEKGVTFANLGFVVIDEQHRFGVLQRALLRGKGSHPDVLVMTATPIPRTLSLTLFGDLDVSVIDELPVGRRPVKTVVKTESEMNEVAAFVHREIEAGHQAYFVYPLIEESENLDLKAATVHVHHLQRDMFPGLRLGLLHGRMRAEERDEIMTRFLRREIDILVATTVIEVGIDVPNATIMVIENAERFGLSQLHQLRGRVGRGSDQSTCVLVTKRWIATRTERKFRGTTGDLSLEQQHQAERRLAAMVETNDGFVIAEIDLRLRGPGDFFGTRQSGVPEFRVADILTDTALLNDARADAFEIVGRDPRLIESDHRQLGEILHSGYRDEMELIETG
jgi:ATP-dependent DNA helicase RecG